ncbi:MAG: hypothetical protein NT001_03930, partial [Candidatus Woesearchaeota archaeon]|nr:hypothetical protein [Candidatus Woesearchaeota archaeon]
MLNRLLIYDAPQKQFVRDVLLNKFADTMQDNFLKSYGKRAGEPEFKSWADTGKVIKNLIELGCLENVYVSFEYQVPYTQKRIDCLLFGKDKDGKGIV